MCSFSNRPPRRGISSLEVMVAFTLLASVLAVSTPLLVAHSRLLKAQRNYRLALDELSNQLDRLTSLPEAELSPAVAELAPSPLAVARLPGAKLTGQLADADRGRRLTLEITWDQPNRQAAPVRLTAWIAAPSANTAPPEEQR